MNGQRSDQEQLGRAVKLSWQDSQCWWLDVTCQHYRNTYHVVSIEISRPEHWAWSETYLCMSGMSWQGFLVIMLAYHIITLVHTCRHIFAHNFPTHVNTWVEGIYLSVRRLSACLGISWQISLAVPRISLSQFVTALQNLNVVVKAWISQTRLLSREMQAFMRRAFFARVLSD